MATHSTTADRLAVGDLIPRLRLPTAASGAPRPLRGSSREAVVLLALHDPDCDDCASYLRRLADASARFRLWDGRVRGLTDDADGGARLQARVDEAAGDGRAVDVLVDEDRTVLRRLAPDAGPGVALADRYGQLFHLWAGGDEHALPGPRELEEWLQYLATQCPE